MPQSMEETSALISAVSLLSIVFLTLVIKKLINFEKSSPANRCKLPPGPWKLPLIGSMHHLIGDLPHRRLAALAETYGPLLHLKLGEINLITISSAELAADVLKTHDVNFASRPQLLAGRTLFYNYSNIGFAPYGKFLAQLRKICTLELLSSRRVKSFSLIREEEGRNMVDKIRTAAARGSPVNLTELLLSAVNNTVAKAAFGKKFAHQQMFLIAMREVMKLLSGFNSVDMYPSLSFLARVSGLSSRMERLHKKLDEVLNEIIEEHQAKNRGGDDEMDEDLVDVLLRIKDQGELEISLTIDNIKGVILDMFIAGTDTTSAVIVWAMAELIRHPKIMNKAQLEIRKVFDKQKKIDERYINELPYFHQILKETFRLHPTGALLSPRICCETIELSGWTIPSGSWMMINAWAIMRDSKNWVEPESFYPERFEGNKYDYKGSNFEYLPFGSGRRMCPGITFGLASTEILLAQLLFHFDWELPGGMKAEELNMNEAFSLSVVRKDDLCLLALPHI